MRRLFIVRKDLKMSTGKISAQLAHCAECYWLHLIQKNTNLCNEECRADFVIDKEIWDEYINGSIRKTICQAKNKTHLLKAVELANELGLKEGKDYGLIYDACYTELTPEEDDGTCLTAFWTAPLKDEIAHAISKKYHLYQD